MLTKSSKSILRALALILAVLMTASVCLVGCTDKNAQATADEAKSAAEAAQKLAQEAKDAATSAVSKNTLSEELAKVLDQAKAQATADITTAIADLAKKADLESMSATAAATFATELAKKVNSGDVYTKAEIESRLSQIAGGVSTAEVSEKIEKALKEAKAYTDAAIKKLGTADTSDTTLSEEAIAGLINAAFTSAFDEFDAVTGELVLAIGVIYMDIVKIYNRSYKPADFVNMYNTYLKKYFELDLDGEKFDGRISQQKLNLNYYSVIPSILTFVRLSNSEDLAAILDDFNNAAKTYSIDEAVKDLADEILKIGTQVKLNNVPKAYVVSDDYQLGCVAKEKIDIDGNGDTEYCDFDIPAVVAFDEYPTYTNLSGKAYKWGNKYDKGDLIYVANGDTYSIMRVTKSVTAATTPTDFAEVIDGTFVVIEDWEQYEAVLEKIYAFIDYFGVDDTDSTIYVQTKNCGKVVIANYVKDAFTVEDGAAATGKQAVLPVSNFKDGSGYTWGYTYNPSSPEKSIGLGVFELIEALSNEYEIELELDNGGLWTINTDKKQGQAQALIGLDTAEDFYYISGSQNTFGKYVWYYFNQTSNMFDFSTRWLERLVELAQYQLATKTDNSVYDVEELYGEYALYTQVDPAVASTNYKALIDKLDAAIKAYEYFNLGDDSAIQVAKDIYEEALENYNDYDEDAARKNRDALSEQEYLTYLSKMVNMLRTQYMNNPEYARQLTTAFMDHADDIILEAYRKASAEDWADVSLKIAAVDATGFTAKLEKYMEETYFKGVRADIKEAFGRYSWWITIERETEKLLQDYIDLYKALPVITSPSALAYYVSETNASLNKYYSLEELMFGTAKKDVQNIAKTNVFKPIVDKLDNDIKEFMKTTPAEGKYYESCEHIYDMIDAAVLDAAEAWTKALNDSFKLVDKHYAEVKGQFETFKASMTELLVAAGIDPVCVEADFAALDKELKDTEGDSKKYPVMSLIGPDYALKGSYTDLFDQFLTSRKLTKYEVALETVEYKALKLILETSFVVAQNEAYDVMSAYYEGDVGGTQYVDILNSDYVVACKYDMEAIFEYYYNQVFNLELKWEIPSYKVEGGKVVLLNAKGEAVTKEADAAKQKVDMDAYVAYMLAVGVTMPSATDAVKEDVEDICKDIEAYVATCKEDLYDYSHNRADYDQYLKDAKKLVKAIQSVNKLKKFYVTGSAFDNAVKALEEVIANATYSIGADYTGKTFAIDTTATMIKAFTDVNGYEDAYGTKIKFEGYNADKKTWTAKTFYEAKNYVAYCISNVEVEMAYMWLNQNPLLVREDVPADTQAKLDEYAAIIEAVLRKLPGETAPANFEKTNVSPYVLY